MRKIVIAGGTGFLGTYLSSCFRSMGHQVLIISRLKADFSWNDPQGIARAINNSDAVINLAGKSVDCRYHEKNKREILNSRLFTTLAIGQAIAACEKPPKLWINSSTATIYRHAEDRPMTEKDGEIGKGFSVDVAKQWEKAFFDFSLPATRQVALRMAIVLGKQGGVMKPLKNLVKFGLGGRQGNGRQMFSWIHIEDVMQIILFVMHHPAITGILNCSAPHPVNNEKLMQSLRQMLHKKIGLPSPAWLLELGAVLIRTETELVLKSRWVLPERLLLAGYQFRFPGLEVALKEILD